MTLEVRSLDTKSTLLLWQGLVNANKVFSPRIQCLAKYFAQVPMLLNFKYRTKQRPYLRRILQSKLQKITKMLDRHVLFE
jgi:hypothetical protein